MEENKYSMMMDAFFSVEKYSFLTEIFVRIFERLKIAKDCFLLN